MAWTDSNTVNKHLMALDVLPTDYENVAVELDASGVGQLPHMGIVDSSEQVKLELQLDPQNESLVTLNGESWVQLAYSDLIPEEIIIAEDDTLQNIYKLDTDFCFNHADGKVRRIDGGGITDGASVEIYYRRYQVMTEITDYTIDNSTGKITVVDTGSLEKETTVSVDYQTSAASGADQLISEAITEAEDKILNLLSSDYDASSTDQGLITGATELSVAIVCRGLASRALSDGVPSAEGRSRGWRELAAIYREAAFITLQRFLSSPLPTSGSRKTNSNWNWV